MASAHHAACDGTAAAASPDQGAPHANLTLFACMLASSLAFLDGSVMNVALPAIGRDLHAGAADLQWTINGFLLPLSALLLMGGAAGDHFGRRRLLIGGVALFLIASLGCALAPAIGWLHAARALQGVGAAMLMPNSLAVLGSAFTGEARGRAIGTWAAMGAIASALGPVLGGWLVETVGWRTIFLLNLPFGLGAILLAWRYVTESAPGERALDWWGAALATVALFAVTYALTLWSSQHALSVPIGIGLAPAAAAIAGFIATEHRLRDGAMMPLAMFGSRAFVGLTLLTLFLYGALGGLVLLLPYLLITGGYTPSQAGMALLPFSIVVGTTSRLVGRLTARTGARLPLSVGPLVTAAGFALLVRVDPSASYWTSVFPGMLVLAFGMAGAVAPLTTAVLSSVDDRHTGTASGFNSAVARTGGLIATALVGAVIAQKGAALLGAFHAATLIGAALAAAAGVTAFLTLSADHAKDG